jgi:hypothetical protein
MADKNQETKNVFALTEKGERTYWTKVGVAYTNRDSSINVQLDALPVSGRLQIRSDDKSEQR